MDARGARKCPICGDWCYPSQMKEGVKSRVPEIETIEVCVECHDDWRTDPEYAHLRPDYSPDEAEQIRQRREFNREHRIFF